MESRRHGSCYRRENVHGAAAVQQQDSAAAARRRTDAVQAVVTGCVVRCSPRVAHVQRQWHSQGQGQGQGIQAGHDDAAGTQHRASVPCPSSYSKLRYPPFTPALTVLLHPPPRVEYCRATLNSQSETLLKLNRNSPVSQPLGLLFPEILPLPHFISNLLRPSLLLSLPRATFLAALRLTSALLSCLVLHRLSSHTTQTHSR